MALNFPNNPTVGQDHLGVNNVVYRWDGEKWMTVGSEQANSDNYLRRDIDDTYDGTITATGTGAFGVPVGTEAQQPGSPVEGMVRYNTTLGRYEGYSNGAWGALGGGATGGGADRVFQTNTMVVTTDFTLPAGESADSAGPITINDGVSVSIPDNQNWVIL